MMKVMILIRCYSQHSCWLIHSYSRCVVLVVSRCSCIIVVVALLTGRTVTGPWIFKKFKYWKKEFAGTSEKRDSWGRARANNHQNLAAENVCFFV